jgi:hypothetical protein
MAENASNNISYYLVINESHKDDLAGIRQWNNLKAAFEAGSIWIKDLDYAQVNSLEVKSIPYKTVFYEKQGKLFPHNSLLPDRNVPALLWTPVERALPVKLPAFNHNYFGIKEKTVMRLISSPQEAEAEGMIIGIEQLEAYLLTAPAVRLQKLSWTLLNNDLVFLFGKPLLPVDAAVYWKRNNFMLPAGQDFELHLLSDTLNALLNPDNDHLIIWDTNNTYSLVEKSDLQPLSLSSFRKTRQTLIPNP